MTGHRQAIVAAARRWIGTPYVHQSSRQGAGCDCLGLIRGIWRDVIGSEPEAPPPYSFDWSEADHVERLWGAAWRHLVQRPVGCDPAPGDVLLFRMRSGSVAKHLGVQTEVGAVPRFVHAYSGHGVVENTLSAPWARRVVARFEFPEEQG